MKVTESAPLWASILLQCATFAAAQQTISASGPLTPCPGYHLSNSSSLNATLSPDNGSLSFEVSGLDTVPGNATLSIALIANGKAAYNATIDPCTVTGLPDLCPADGKPTGPMKASVQVTGDAFDSENPGSDVALRLRLWVDVNGRDQSRHQTACVERVLQTGDSAAGSGENSSSAQAGSDNTTNSTNDADDAGSDNADLQDSGAGSMGGAMTLFL